MVAKILYISVHTVLEYDDLRILTRAGYQVFSLGVFAKPGRAFQHLRPFQPEFLSLDDLTIAEREGWLTRQDKYPLAPRLTAEFLDRFDVMIVNHHPAIILENADLLFSRQRLQVIFRSVGQVSFEFEAALKPFADRLIVVRYSPREHHPDLMKTDAVIRFGKYSDEFPAWIGGDRLLTFMHNAAIRPYRTPSIADYQQIVEGHPADLCGRGNKGIGTARGEVDYSTQMELYRSCRAYIYMHSDGACYTLNFIEATLTGAPILVPSATLIKATNPPNWWPERYEIPDLLADTGFVYSSVAEAREILSHLEEFDLASISSRSRARARDLFDARRIEREWRDLIEAR